MRIQINEPIDVLTWGYRLLYVLLFILLMVMMGYWQLPFTIWYFGAILALLFPLLVSRKELLTVEVITPDVHLNEQQRPIIEQ